MRHITFILSLIGILFSQASMAQFNYQAVLRDASNNPIIDTDLEIKVEILQNDEATYTELHSSISSEPKGIITLAIGTGVPQDDPYSAIDWSTGDPEIRLTVGNDVLPASPIRAVPMAEYTKNKHWQWSSSDSVLSFNNGRVAVNTQEIGNSTFKIQGYPDRFTLSLDQGQDGGDYGMIFRSPNSQFSGRISMDDNLFSIGRGNYHKVINLNNGFVGIREQDPVEPLHVSGRVRINRNGAALQIHSSSEGGSVFMEYHRTGSETSEDRSGYIGYGSGGSNPDLTIRNEEPGGKIRLLSDDVVELKCVQITGGCDIKEDLNSIEDLQAGDIVVIDESNPGNIRRTNEIYDIKVAGVISGANGINPGLSLSQTDVMEGEFPLTMLGRVYVKVTGKVQVGDMLTTSTVPGHAMAVTDYEKAYGAVIGKAMSDNPEGEGMVLVLVNLQ